MTQQPHSNDRQENSVGIPPFETLPPEVRGEDQGLGAIESGEDESLQYGTLTVAKSLSSIESAENIDLIDGGMRAVEPILADGAVLEQPPEPQEEISRPPKSSMQGAPVFSAAAYQDPGPTVGEKIPAPLFQDQPLEAQEALVAFFVTDERLNHLWERIDQAQRSVSEQVNNAGLADELLDQLQSARNELMGGRDRFEEAERFVNQVDYRLQVVRRLGHWSQTRGIRLFFYELLFAVLPVTVLFVTLGEGAFAGGQPIFVYLLGSMMWGCLGGITGAMLALVRHIAVDQDFDVQHTIWYLASPLMGMVVGLFIYAVLEIGVLSISGGSQVQSPFVIYVLSWLGGYQHNVFTDIVRRVLKVFEVRFEEEQSSTEPQNSERPQ